MPYDENECDTQPDDAQKELAESNKIENYFYLDPDMVFEQTKASLLNDQPVVIAITIDRSYFGARDENGEFIYRKFKSGDGGHAMLVVGYDDERNAFKVVNSWGKGWGNEGFVWIDYKAFQEAGDLTSDFPVLCEAWITNDIEYLNLSQPHFDTFQVIRRDNLFCCLIWAPYAVLLVCFYFLTIDKKGPLEPDALLAFQWSCRDTS